MVTSYFVTVPNKINAKNAINVITTNITKPLATTTLNYLSPGVGTTTLSLYTADNDQIGLNILFNASSTASTLKWRYEFSVDGTNWFAQDNGLSTTATTTVLTNTNTDYSWTFASSTQGSSQTTASISTSFKHVDLLNVGSPFTRIVFFMPIGSTNGAIYVQATLKTANAI